MQIQEEYIRRHNLNVDVIKYPTVVNVLLRNDNYQWLLLNGTWEHEVGHPSFYNFLYFRPNHNGYFLNYFDKLNYWEKIYWDKYEDFLNLWILELKYSKELGFKAVTDESEVILNFWEIFLYTHDAWIAQNFPSNSKFYDLVHQSTDKSNHVNDRIRAYRYAVTRLEDYLENISLKKIFSFSKNYSYWLAGLINK